MKVSKSFLKETSSQKSELFELRHLKWDFSFMIFLILSLSRVISNDLDFCENLI